LLSTLKASPKLLGLEEQPDDFWVDQESEQVNDYGGDSMNPPASVSPKIIDAITLFVEDLERSKRFYQEVFGLPVFFEDENSAVFRFENTLINLLKIPAARSLIAPGVVASPEAGSRFQFTIPVDDVDAACVELQSRGVKLLNGPIDRPWGIRTASFSDPGGHIWEVAHRLPRAGD
jgi:catechol 2,3-dioxygenase-like lactoylglutathione lyase family enzyme